MDDSNADMENDDDTQASLRIIIKIIALIDNKLARCAEISVFAFKRKGNEKQFEIYSKIEQTLFSVSKLLCAIELNMSSPVVGHRVKWAREGPKKQYRILAHSSDSDIGRSGERIVNKDK